MAVLYILWLREVRRYRRSRAQVLVMLSSPILYLFALGFGFGPVFAQSGRGNYLQFVAPGVVAMGILFTSAVAGLSLLWDRQFGFLKATLVAPVPRLQLMVGRTLGGATVGAIQGTLVLIVCLVAGFRPQPAGSWLLAALFIVLIAIVFAALGIAMGAPLREVQGFQLIISLVVTPIFFLSGALFPLTNLPPGLAVVTRLDPLSYGVDGLRAAFNGFSHFGIATDLAVLGLAASAFFAFGAYSFSRIQA